MPRPAVAGLGMDAFERFLFLRTVPDLSSLPAEVVRVIAAHTCQKTFPSGSYVYRQDQPAKEVQCIVDGAIEVRRNGTPVRTLGPGALAGGVSAITGDDQDHDAVTLGDTVTLRIATDDLREVMEDHFILLRNVLEATSREAIGALRQLGSGAGFSPLNPSLECPDRALDLVERMAFLRQDSVLRDAHIEAISDLASELVEVRIPSGQPLWDIGDPGTDFLIVLCGRIECHAEEPEQHFNRGASDSVGSIDALAGMPRWFRAKVAEDIVALRVDVDVFYDVLEDHTGMAMSLLRQLSQATLGLYDARAAARGD